MICDEDMGSARSQSPWWPAHAQSKDLSSCTLSLPHDRGDDEFPNIGYSAGFTGDFVTKEFEYENQKNSRTNRAVAALRRHQPHQWSTPRAVRPMTWELAT